MEHDDGKRELLRHTLATLAYRGSKTVRDVAPAFGDFSSGEKSRTPVQIVGHIGDLFAWALSMARGKEAWKEAKPGSWDEAVNYFYDTVKSFDEYLASTETLAVPPEKLFQGPIADALTHVGQLAMLRRMFGAPIRGENYARATIAAGSVGREQADPRREFD